VKVSVTVNGSQVAAEVEDRTLLVHFLREQAGLSRIELARRVGVNPQTIGYLERGEYNPSLVLAFRLADLFDLTIEQIFARENG